MNEPRPAIDSSDSQPPSRDLLIGLLLGCVVGAVIPTILMRGREPSGPPPSNALTENGRNHRGTPDTDVASLTPPDSAPAGFVEFLPLPTEAERRLERALDQTVSINFTDTPLTDVANFLAETLSVPFVIDTESLNEEGIATDSPVTRRLPNISARAALNLMLQPLALEYVIEDEVLKVTTAAKAKEKLITRTYPVSDLCRHAGEFQALILALEEETTGTWMDIAGEGGTITAVEHTGSLIVRQSRKVQQEMLSLIRRQREALRRYLPANSSRPKSPRPVPGQMR